MVCFLCDCGVSTIQRQRLHMDMDSMKHVLMSLIDLYSDSLLVVTIFGQDPNAFICHSWSRYIESF